MTRPRGFASWRPQKATQQTIDAVGAVLDEYAEYLPLTLRQIFYRLVGTGKTGKTEREYAALCETLNRARRAQLIPMDAIRDDGFTGGFGPRLGYCSIDEFKAEILARAHEYRYDRQAGQPQRLVVWCEATGMVPQLEHVADDYGVTVKSSGGFDSLTVKHGAAEHFNGVNVLHIGDHDPSGEVMFDALEEDVCAFADAFGHDIEFSRIAVNPRQVIEYELPTAPPKDSSHQARKRMVETVQAEAMDPADLADELRAAIESRMDMTIYRLAGKTEIEQRAEVVRWLSRDGGASL